MARQAGLGAKPEPLHDAGTKAFDQSVGVRDQLERGLDGLGLLQVQRYRAATAVDEIGLLDAIEGVAGGRRLAVDPDHVRAHV